MMSRYFVANWKMKKPFNDAVQWCTHNLDALGALQGDTTQIVICPNFTALSTIADVLQKQAIHVGAQNCSQYEEGSYTGDVDAFSIAEVGAEYCIIGHSERRTYYGETNDMIANKFKQLAAHGVHPIVCIGENQEQNNAGNTHSVLQKQLESIVPLLKSVTKCLIAYEPIWAIGSGKTPSTKHLKNTFAWIENYITTHAPQAHVSLLYGGSADENNAKEIMAVQHVSGLLIGSASLNFQKFEKIVSLGNMD